MKYLSLAFIALLLGQASAQTLIEKLYLMRSDTTTVDAYTGMTHICVVVFPDGRYRMERSFQGMQGGTPETKIFMDTLPAEDLSKLQAALDNDDLQKIKTGQARGGIVNDMDVLSLSVPREHRLQNIEFETAAERKPYEKALKPFLNSLKTLEKRKVAAAKSETPNNCAAPMVRYRYESGQPAENDMTNPQQP